MSLDDLINAQIDGRADRVQSAMEEAIAHRDAARCRFNEATTARARRDADEDLNFWIGKVAALSARMAYESPPMTDAERAAEERATRTVRSQAHR